MVLGVGVVLLGRQVFVPGAELNLSPVFLHLASVGPDSSSVVESLGNASEVSSGGVVSLVGTLGVVDVVSKRFLGMVEVVSSSLEGFPGLSSLGLGVGGVGLSDVVGSDGVLEQRF